MKKLLSIILALALVLSLAACGGAGLSSADNNLTEEKLKGTWCLELDITAMSEIVGDSLGATMGMSDITPYLDAIPDDLSLSVYMVFDGEGTLSAMLKKQEINDFYTGMINALMTEDTMYAIFEAQGMDKETVDAALAAQGMSLSTLIAATKLQLSSTDFAETMAGASGTIAKGDYFVMEATESYTIEGNKVIAEDTVLEYDGTNLLLTEVESENENIVAFSKLLPLAVKKVSDKTEY